MASPTSSVPQSTDNVTRVHFPVVSVRIDDFCTQHDDESTCELQRVAADAQCVLADGLWYYMQYD